LEFISANPTGPLHLGHTRWAAVGDALGRVLTAAGADVTREFYINDRGNQMDLFGQSVQAAALGQPIPEDGYQGEYIADLAKEVLAQNPTITALADEMRDVIQRFGPLGASLWPPLALVVALLLAWAISGLASALGAIWPDFSAENAARAASRSASPGCPAASRRARWASSAWSRASST
jgi:hypothetical protein